MRPQSEDLPVYNAREFSSDLGGCLAAATQLMAFEPCPWNGNGILSIGKTVECFAIEFYIM